jgi:hypothetical protein
MNDYQQQAADFLTKHGIAFSFKLANTKRPSWDNGRKCNHFVVTLKKGNRRVSFDFFDSTSNFEKGVIVLDAYSVLACCSSELHCPDTFEEFCGDFGYETDSWNAYNTFKALRKMSKKLQKFFDNEQMREDLSEIQ